MGSSSQQQSSPESTAHRRPKGASKERRNNARVIQESMPKRQRRGTGFERVTSRHARNSAPYPIGLAWRTTVHPPDGFGIARRTAEELPLIANAKRGAMRKVKRAYPEQRVETVFVIKPLLWGLRKVALQANHHNFCIDCVNMYDVRRSREREKSTHLRGSPLVRQYRQLRV